MDKLDKTIYLNGLQRSILTVADDIKTCRHLGGDPHGYLSEDENHLEDMLRAVLELKKLEGIRFEIEPSGEEE